MYSSATAPKLLDELLLILSSFLRSDGSIPAAICFLILPDTLKRVLGPKPISSSQLSTLLSAQRTVLYDWERLRNDGKLLGGTPVTGSQDVVRIVSALRPHQRVVFTVVRGQKRLSLPVVLGERPLDPRSGR